MNETDYHVGIYIRLSQEDKDKKYEAESESVTNQRELLNEYVKNNNMILIQEYVDDGFSGTNFDRPGFKKMIEDIQKSKINCVIVKDLSRLGRDHIMTGYYLETFFPENHIRFISLQEAYDSSKIQASNDSSTFIIACNDYYSKQNSIKIRTVLNEKRKKGKFIGSLPSYGYMRDPEDKGHLIPNPEIAPIVKKIFEWRASGIGPTYIANRLNSEGIPTPSALKKIKYSSRLLDSSKWTITTVRKILYNRMYVGDMVQHIQTTLNYKSKKKVPLDKKLWIVIENTHEPIIDRETFDYCASLRKANSRVAHVRTEREKRLFEGKLYCAECGNKLGVFYRKKRDYWSVNCNRYVRDPIRRRCYPHFFAYDYLESILIDKITNSLKKNIENLDINKLNNEVAKRIKTSTETIEKEKTNLENEKNKLTKRLTILYEDRCNDVITAEMYKELSKDYNTKISNINIQLDKLNFEQSNVKDSYGIIPNYTKKIKKLLDLKKSRKELYDLLIDRIIADKDRNINIKFKYNVIPEITFKYEDNRIHNPFGTNGKPKNER